MNYLREQHPASDPAPNRLLSLPLELREQIYAYLFAPCIWTTEHPFPSCLPSAAPGRFRIYTTLLLVSHALHDDIKTYFSKFIAPNLKVYFHTLTSLRAFQALAHHNPLLKSSTFHLCSGNAPARASNGVTLPRHPKQTLAEAEEIEAVIRIQPGFKWWMDEVPGFYRARPAVQTNYGYFPPSSTSSSSPAAPAAMVAGWKPWRYGIAVFQQTGGEVCDSPSCPQRAAGAEAVGVTEVRYPPLRSKGDRAGEKQPLSLSCFIWAQQGGDAESFTPPRHRPQASIMVLAARLKDMWLPQNVVETYLKLRRERME